MWSDLCVQVNEYKGGVKGLLIKFNFNFRVNNSDIFLVNTTIVVNTYLLITLRFVYNSVNRWGYMFVSTNK
jgi:hypothetical protein